MLHIPNIKLNHRLGIFAFLGFLSSVGVGALQSAPTHAASANDFTPYVTVSFGAPQGDLYVQPGLSYYDSTKFYLPVEIGLKNISAYTVKVYGSGSSLVSGSDSIPTIGTDTAYTDFGKDGSQWGIRWNLGDSVEDKDVNYHKVPASSSDDSSVVVENQSLPRSSAIIKKQLTLGFAVAVDGNQPSGSYTNTITVAVVASPREARSIFDISTMQEMSPDICANTTTPNAGAISTGADINATGTMGIDTKGDYPDNPNYVPQVELTDSRDGKKYTVRKLADGNCWMVSNLEFDLVPTSAKSDGETPSSAFSTNGTDKLTGSDLILTKDDTDLNSMDTWTPAISVETYGTVGTVFKTQKVSGVAWTDNSYAPKGLRSFSSAAAYPDAAYSTKTAATPTFGTSSTGEPWQRFGNLYSWDAATLGFSTKLISTSGVTTDSICPKGWKLPDNTGDSSFSSLLGKYELTATNATTNISAQVNQLANFPLNFLRTGYYEATDGKITGRTGNGDWWSSFRVAEEDAGELGAGATHLGSITTHISPQYVSPRGIGFAIRCVARK